MPAGGSKRFEFELLALKFCVDLSLSLSQATMSVMTTTLVDNSDNLIPTAVA